MMKNMLTAEFNLFLKCFEYEIPTLDVLLGEHNRKYLA